MLYKSVGLVSFAEDSMVVLQGISENKKLFLNRWDSDRITGKLGRLHK